jgi:TPR repeat protein
MLWRQESGTCALRLRATKLWTQAAEVGNPYAQFDLAELYWKGIGVPCDLPKAYALFTKAGKSLDVSKPLVSLSAEMRQEVVAYSH